jgi:type IV secretion system protein VirB3
MSGGRLTADPLFQGLARPPMIAGVSYMYFVLNAMICMILFINTKSFAVIPLAGVIHMFGYLLCMKEPRAIELWMLRMKYGFRSWNRAYHSFTNSYDVF